MLKVGITGGIGSGKSTVCRLFSVLGIPVYDADLNAKLIMNEDEKLVAAIKELIGEDAYTNGVYNRRFVSSLIFSDRLLLEKLNAIVHPAVSEHFIAWEQTQKEAPYVIKEAAIMFESGTYKMNDLNVLVYASKETRLRRVQQRDMLSKEDILKRMNNQMDEEEKRKYADHVIMNEEDSLLIPRVMHLHQLFLQGLK